MDVETEDFRCDDIDVDPLFVGVGVCGGGGDDAGGLAGGGAGEVGLVVDEIDGVLQVVVYVKVLVDAPWVRAGVEGALDLDVGQGWVFGDDDVTAEEVDVDEDWLGLIEVGGEGERAGCGGGSAAAGGGDECSYEEREKRKRLEEGIE